MASVLLLNAQEALVRLSGINYTIDLLADIDGYDNVENVQLATVKLLGALSMHNLEVLCAPALLLRKSNF